MIMVMVHDAHGCMVKKNKEIGSHGNGDIGLSSSSSIGLKKTLNFSREEKLGHFSSLLFSNMKK